MTRKAKRTWGFSAKEWADAREALLACSLMPPSADPPSPTEKLPAAPLAGVSARGHRR